MKQLKLIKFFFVLAMIFIAGIFTYAQNLKGKIIDEKGEGIPGVAIQVVSLGIGTVTDVDGKYSFALSAGTHIVIYSFLGYGSITKTIIMGTADQILDVDMSTSATILQELVISTGSRNSQRTIIDAPVPVDILSAADLKSTGQVSFDKALQYRVPSFNTVNTPVNDATTLLDPYEIRNMGPSRTLVLIDGKRKNLSSLLYVQFSPGRGETGVDLSAIPQDAIERVEILRDGASAQYGSDAIAGVMNVILKSRSQSSSLNVNVGTTTKKNNGGLAGDTGHGQSYGISLNSGYSNDKKYLNYTVGFKHEGSVIRSGIVDVPTEIATFGGSPAQDALITSYLKDYPTGNNVNGSGEVTGANFLINGGINFSEKGLLYVNAAIVAKKVNSFANFRTPYWRQDRGLLHSSTDNGGKNYITSATLAFPEDPVALYKGYTGYVPTFEGDLKDYNATIGIKNTLGAWKTDVSLTTGGNTQTYTVNNTVNRTLGISSPTFFKPGGFSFSHLVGNIDLSRNLTDKISLSIGSEARNETYKIIAGDDASVTGEGSNSFPGINPVNAATNSRFNIGAYADLNFDITQDFLISGAFRTEKYSDFGNASVWKIASRYKLLDNKLVFRGSVSTGFRAPTLHQIYAQSIQASFAGGTIVSSGLFNNNSAQARLLGIQKLKPEKSTNLTLGVGLNPTRDLNLTLDFYNISIKDRIVYSSSISTSDASTALYNILQKNGLVSVQFFINGIKTNTSGLDFVLSQRNLNLGLGKLGISLAGNVVLDNEIVGSPNEPAAIKSAGSSILNEQVKSLLTEGRPNYKVILGFDYSLGKWNFNLYNTLFGPTAFRDLDNGGSDMLNIKAEFDPAVVSDLSIGYRISDKVSLTLNANNILNVLPKWDLVASPAESVVDKAASIKSANEILSNPGKKSLLRGFLGFSGRYDILGYNGSQFSQLGTILNANLSIKF
jgi:iron complex outermembrane recepter protein